MINQIKHKTMATKIRVIRNWVTTVIGTLLLLGSVALFIISKLKMFEFDFTYVQLLPTVLLGWVLLMAKDSILEGITMGVFKIKEKDND